MWGLLFLIIFNSLNADISHGVLQRYKKNSNTFVTTGFKSGMNIIKAVNAGFQEIYCIEQENYLVEHSKISLPLYFRNGYPLSLQKMQIVCENPKIYLRNVIESINAPMVFLLCSHLPEFDQPYKEITILEELEIIKRHPIKQHIILIDYINWVGTPYFGNISFKDLQDKLLEINEKYQFNIAMGGHLEKEKNAILIAYLN